MLDIYVFKFAQYSHIRVFFHCQAGAKATCSVSVHVLDENDNAPEFKQQTFDGYVSEAAALGALVLTNDSAPLVIKAGDKDSEVNALLEYDIVEELARRFFRVDPSTGAIRTQRQLDFEQYPSFTFHVRVSDRGKPRLSSDALAQVRVKLLDVNDCPPVFAQAEYSATLLLPTYQHVALLSVHATDPDSPDKTQLRYDIIEGNTGQSFVL